jgi:hypothetical protein
MEIKLNYEFEPLYPVVYNDKIYYKKDCDELFIDMYRFRYMLNENGGIYLSEDMWLYPDGSMKECL